MIIHKHFYRFEERWGAFLFFTCETCNDRTCTFDSVFKGGSRGVHGLK